MKLGLNKMSKKRQKTTNKKTAQNTQKKSDTKLEVKPTDSKMKSVKRQPKRIREARFDKLDNTANLFPVIASRKSSNVYRIAATLTEEIQPEKLQQALDMVLPYFDVMHVRMKTGVFWYYFEDNPNPAPRVMQEDMGPCQYINPLLNREYLFRVLYYERRISLEVFHALTDGNGALMFLKELVYQYLRLVHPEIGKGDRMELHEETTVDREDSYLKHYKRPAKKSYKTEKALVIRGEMFPREYFGIMHGYLHLPDVKRVAKQYGVTVNQYLIVVFAWSVYKGYMHSIPHRRPLAVCVPVNLRPYYGSATTKNFFAVVSAMFRAEREDYTFEEVLAQVAESLKSQITKEHLEEIMAYNVSNEKNKALRATPLFIKNIAMKIIYQMSAKANSGCVTNLGLVKLASPYDAYVESLYATLSMSKNQNLKAAVVSYKDTLVFTFSSAVREVDVQKVFFRKLAEDGIDVSVETNGVYYE